MNNELPKVGAEVFICSGMHQFQHGRIASIDSATEIPFAHVQLRGAAGQILVNSGAYCPLKYCTEIEEEVIAAILKAAKAIRKARREADKVALEKFTESEVESCAS